MCIDLRAKCESKCANAKFWGAIAYSAKDKGVGWSRGIADLDKAKKVAMDNCVKHGSECKLWAWFASSCGALVQDGKVVTWGAANAKRDAEDRALLECRKAGGTCCAVEVSLCSR